MEVEQFEKNLKYVNLNGITLNLEEKLELKLSLNQLQIDLKLENLYLWGKVQGNPQIVTIVF